MRAFGHVALADADRVSHFAHVNVAAVVDPDAMRGDEVAWLRRCERFYGTGAGQCPEARCMLALSIDLVWRALEERLGIVGA